MKTNGVKLFGWLYVGILLILGLLVWSGLQRAEPGNRPESEATEQLSVEGQPPPPENPEPRSAEDTAPPSN
ncbi:MAG: hypothetical protein U0840_17995 [Gemmataceae bacterium]